MSYLKINSSKERDQIGANYQRQRKLQEPGFESQKLQVKVSKAR